MTLLDVAVASGCIMLHHAAPRIVYLQTPQGGGKTEQEARVQATAIRLNYYTVFIVHLLSFIHVCVCEYTSLIYHIQFYIYIYYTLYMRDYDIICIANSSYAASL